jgi:hypothetical protein
MKTLFILIPILFATASTSFGQNNDLKKEQIKSIQILINTFKSRNNSKIAQLISYPLRREFPLKDVKNITDFEKRFFDIFDKELIDHVAKSTINDWSEVGWRGIMFDNGTLWINEEGKIRTVNYQSTKEKQLLADAIQADKNQLPKSLQDFQKPLYLIFTKNYKIRIDKKSEDIYRYAAWKIKSQKREPDIIIENGVIEFEGSGGNHTITFKKNGYNYVVSINELGNFDTPDATLEVSKQQKILLTEEGKIKRN